MIRIEDANVEVRPYVKAGIRKGWEADVIITPSGAARRGLVRVGLAPRPRRRRKAPSKTRSAAERWGRGMAVEFVEEINRVLDPDANDSQPVAPKEVPTLAAFFPRYITGHHEANRSQSSTIKSVKNAGYVHLIPAMGRKRLDRISVEDIQQFKADRGHLEPTTVNLQLKHLRALLNVAVEWKVIPVMPVKIKLLKEGPPKERFYDFEELDRLIIAAERLGNPNRLLAVLLGGEAGLRRGEIRAFRWSDFDSTRGTLTVARRLYLHEVGLPKGGRPRTLPLLERLGEALREHRHLRHDNVLLTRSGTPPSGPTVARWVQEAQEEAGLKAEGPHILRHTFCSHAAMQGVPIDTIREWAGHADLRETQRYMHLSPTGSREAAALMKRPANWRDIGNSSSAVVRL